MLALNAPVVTVSAPAIVRACSPTPAQRAAVRMAVAELIGATDEDARLDARSKILSAIVGDAAVPAINPVLPLDAVHVRSARLDGLTFSAVLDTDLGHWHLVVTQPGDTFDF